MDFAGPFTPSGEGAWDMVLVVTDKLTKRAHFVPSKSTDKAPATAKRFFESIVRLHGLPAVIVSDRDTKFTSLFWTTLFDSFGTKLALSTAYHPQTDGQSERMVRTLKEMLRHFISNTQHDWTDHLPILEFAFNNAVHASTGYTPFELDLGYHPATPHSITRPDARNVAAVEDFHNTCDAMRLAAHDAMLAAQQQQAHHHNKGRTVATFKVGDLVLLSNKYIRPPHLQTKGSKKLRSKFIGPFPITRKASPTSYELDLPTNIGAHPVVNAEYLRPYHGNPDRFRGREQPPPAPTFNDKTQELEYIVDKIVNHRVRRGKTEYLLHWQGYADHDNTWDKEDNLAKFSELVKAYWRSIGKEPQVNSIMTTSRSITTSPSTPPKPGRSPTQRTPTTHSPKSPWRQGPQAAPPSTKALRHRRPTTSPTSSMDPARSTSTRIPSKTRPQARPARRPSGNPQSTTTELGRPSF
jgi:hypothetical protein